MGSWSGEVRQCPQLLIKGTNYKRTSAAMEIQRFSRDSFWACAEKEEEDRKEEERWRAFEDRRRREREQILQERREAEERERKMNEKEQMIQKQRKLQAEIEAEARRQEKLKWVSMRVDQEGKNSVLTMNICFSERSQALVRKLNVYFCKS